MELIKILADLAKILAVLGAFLMFCWNFIRARENEEFEIHSLLANSYTDFLKLVIDNSDLYLLSPDVHQQLTDEQIMRRNALFEILISIFERAYLLLYKKYMSKQRQKLWYSWEDFIRQWCRRPDFNNALAHLLIGENPDFSQHIRRIAQQEAQ